jgi:hypothetical protein
LNLRRQLKEIFSERDKIEDEIRKQKEIKDIANYHLGKFKKQLHRNEEQLFVLLEEAISEAESNEEAKRDLMAEIENLKFGYFEEK